MAKIKPIEVIAGMSGKVCTHGDMYFATNSQTGKIYTGKMCYPSHQPPTAKQIAQRELFKTRSQTSLVALWLPPAGEIDASVLWLVAQALLFAASTIGVKSFTINK